MKAWECCVASGVLIALFVLMPIGMNSLLEGDDVESNELNVEQAGISHGERRPFNWYYPNRFEYYYPRHHQDSCNWIYSNGAYSYKCN